MESDSSSLAPLINHTEFRNSPSNMKKKKKASVLAALLKLFLKIAMCAIFIAWAAFLFLFPAEFVSSFSQHIATNSIGTLFGITGSFLLLYSGPIVAISGLAVLYLILFGESELQEKLRRDPERSPRFRLWTFPVLVQGPFGVVSAAELIGILIFIAFIIWSVSYYTFSNLRIVSKTTLSPKLASSAMLELSGLRFGSIGLLLLAFLFIPITRGSILLRLIDIPFEQATRYHVWLGHLTMLIFSLHGLFYVIAWAMQGRLIQEILMWQNIGICNLAGVISLISGLFMWATSLPPVRKQSFELFFYTHQLYVVFVLFFALHVGDFLFSVCAGGIFLFMLDRFLRFCQSRTKVDIIGTTCFPCGTLELVLAKPPGVKYNALSYLFIHVPKLSWLQWHPFSVSSSPRDGDRHISILIKVLGGWTERLMRHISSPTSKITASIEGPYGHGFSYHLTYENLILVAGGIGISPFIAILRDIFHLINGGEGCSPKNILVVWSVKKSEELPLLSIGDMESILSLQSDQLNLEIQMYVTREVEPPFLEEGKTVKSMKHAFPISSRRTMSGLVGTGDPIWAGIYLASSTMGLIIIMALVDAYYVNPYKLSYFSWCKGLIFIVCMILSVLIFGGMVISLWKLWETRIENTPSSEPNGVKGFDGSWVDQFSGVRTICYGRRPNFKEILGKKGEEWGDVDIGVIVCGPLSLETSLAKECRSHNFNRKPYTPIFHFYSHTFDL